MLGSALGADRLAGQLVLLRALRVPPESWGVGSWVLISGGECTTLGDHRLLGVTVSPAAEDPGVASLPMKTICG